MTRWLFWNLLLLLVAANAVFDFGAAPIGLRLAAKIQTSRARDESAIVSFDNPIREAVRQSGRERLVLALAHHLLGARYALTALPLLFLVYFLGRGRLSDEVLANAVTIGAFALVGKVIAWDIIYLLADIASGS